MEIEGRVVVEPGEGETLLSGGFGAVSKLSGAETSGVYSVVEHPMEPGALAAPPHTHADVDEVSFVAEGEVGVWLDGEEFRAGAGSYILKPRGVPHTFWNAGSERARVVEIISPPGFERYFEEIGKVIAEAEGGPPDFGRTTEIAADYGLTFHMERMGELMERHGLELR